MRGVLFCPAFFKNAATTIKYGKQAVIGRVTMIQADRERAEAAKPAGQSA
jgi:hypothetical protein